MVTINVTEIFSLLCKIKIVTFWMRITKINNKKILNFIYHEKTYTEVFICIHTQLCINIWVYVVDVISKLKITYPRRSYLN